MPSGARPNTASTIALRWLHYSSSWRRDMLGSGMRRCSVETTYWLEDPRELTSPLVRGGTE